MDFETVAMKENTITTPKKDNAAEVTDNEDAVEASTTKNEEAIYEELHLYLSMSQYPPGSSKQEKCIIRKRTKNFQIVDGILHYKGKEGIRQVVTENKMKRKILEVCHNDTVGGCHFGRDKTFAKVSARYYWKGIKQDVNDWVN